MCITRIFAVFPIWICGFRRRTFPSSFVNPQKNAGIKSSTGILLTLGLVGGYFLYRKYNAAGNLTFVPGTITEVGTVDGEPYADFTIIAQNTSNTDLQLNSLAANVYANGSLIGNVQNFSGVVVPGNSSTPIPMTMTMFALGIVNDIFRAFQNQTTAQVVEIDGTANVNSFQVPVKLNYSFGG